MKSKDNAPMKSINKDCYCINDRNFMEHEISYITDNIIQYKCRTCNDIEWFFVFNEYNIQVPMELLEGFTRINRDMIVKIGYLDKVNSSINKFKEFEDERRKSRKTDRQQTDKQL